MYKRLAIQLGLVLALTVPVAALAQADAAAAQTHEPTIDDIYKAASSGRLRDADEMIGKVLAAHPGSGKAHFVHAELLAKEGKLAAARTEYAKANELAPGLPFAKPDAVAGLSERLDASKPARAATETPSRLQTSSLTPYAPESAPGMGAPAKLGILALLIAAAVFMYRRIGGARSPAGGGNMDYPSGSVMPSMRYGQPAPSSPGYGYAPAPAPAPGGLAGGLGGALMTGAAMGLGAVAVEEAVRHFTHRDDRTGDILERRPSGASTFGDDLGPDTSADMGGVDFGISDAGSWDGGGDSGGSDW